MIRRHRWFLGLGFSLVLILSFSTNPAAKEKNLWVRLHSIKAVVTVHTKTPEPAANNLPFPTKERLRQSGREILVQVPLENYVAQVLAGELPADFPLEALKAQAVAIRTLASRKDTPHRSEGYDFCDSTHCQLFSYRQKLPSAVTAAVAQTRGLILTQNNLPIHALYHSTCGGHTSSNGAVFGGEPLSYLAGGDDENFCGESPHRTWEARLKLTDLAAIFPEVIQLRGLRVVDQDDAARVLTLELLGHPSQKISAQGFLLRVGGHLGWSTLKSAQFKLTQKGDQFWFQGRGLGHGVGLCQWGARGMALQQLDFTQILHHYFPVTGMRRI